MFVKNTTLSFETPYRAQAGVSTALTDTHTVELAVFSKKLTKSMSHLDLYSVTAGGMIPSCEPEE